MDLENLLAHKRNTKVLVNGSIYDIDKDGVCKDVKDEDAEKLLKNANAWREYDPEATKIRKERMKAVFKSRLIDADGRPIDTGKEESKDDSSETKSEDSETAASADTPADQDGEKSEAGSEETTETQSTEGDPPVPGEGEEWPDPNESMSMEYLKLMADAYEVSYGQRIGKSTLISRITDQMYED